MHKAITIRETFSSRDDAEQARERLQDCGFARNSMNIIRTGNGFELAIRTRPEDADRVQESIEPYMIGQARHYTREMREYTPSIAQSLMLVGAVSAVAGALYYAYTRQRDVDGRYPAGQRRAVQSLYRAHGAPLERHSSRTDCDLPENSKESLDKKLDHALTETFPTSDPVSVSITR